VQTNCPLDAQDSYLNLKTLLDLKVEEFEFYFNLEISPSVCLQDFRDNILCDFVDVYKTSESSSEETSEVRGNVAGRNLAEQSVR
jgi:hypothetical protein